MRGAATALVWLLGAYPGSVAAAPLRPMKRPELCVTLGSLAPTAAETTTRLATESPKLRAVVASPTAQAAALRFTYLGPTSVSAPLASGQIRRQIGIKLRARDGCNVVYVIWRLEPREMLAVSVKRNPGKRTHAECGAHGYHDVIPSRSTPPPQVVSGIGHSLAATLEGTFLIVLADGHDVWQGDIGMEALSFDGPVGLRADNGRFLLELDAAPIGLPSACGGRGTELD